MAEMGFSISQAKSVRDFYAKGRGFFANLDTRQGFAAKIVLAGLVIEAARNPSWGAKAIVDRVFGDEQLGLKEATTAQYRSLARNAVAELRRLGLVPVADASMAESDLLAKAEAVTASHSLRVLSDAVTKGRADKTAAAKVDRDAEAKAKAEAFAKERGVEGVSPEVMAALALQAQLDKLVAMADGGNANAERLLAALEAVLTVRSAEKRKAERKASKPAPLRLAS